MIPSTIPFPDSDFALNSNESAAVRIYFDSRSSSTSQRSIDKESFPRSCNVTCEKYINQLLFPDCLNIGAKANTQIRKERISLYTMLAARSNR